VMLITVCCVVCRLLLWSVVVDCVVNGCCKHGYCCGGGYCNTVSKDRLKVYCYVHPTDNDVKHAD
jgi:hypothetical protein